MSTETSTVSGSLGVDEVESWEPVVGFPDYEVSDMGRVRCIAPRQGRTVPFVASPYLGTGNRPLIRMRDDQRRYHTRRVDEVVLEAFTGPRPTPEHGPAAINGDRQDVRLDNLSWESGAASGRGRGRKPGKTMRKKARVTVRLPSEIRHGHWLHTGNVMVSIQPNRTVELAVGKNDGHQAISFQDLDDAIRILQAAKAIIDG